MKEKILHNRIILISCLFLFNFLLSQTSDELKRFMETYDKIKVDQQANEIVKKGIESDKDPKDRPVKLLVSPSNISKYYDEKLNDIKKEITYLNDLLIYSDSIPPIKDFGYNFFSLRDTVNFIDNLKIDDSYNLGFGDEIIISVWGEVEQYVKKFVQRDGTVYVDNVGLLYLGGKNFSDAKNYIYNRFSKVYSTLNSKPQLSYLDVSVGKLKNINISLTGHVKYPGNYVVNPSINITNILMLAGGIMESGSLRNIMVIRNKTVKDSIDLYPLIGGFSDLKKINFNDGDVLVVPSKGKTIAVNGSIRMPAYYEIKNDDIGSIISYAGGLNRRAKSEIHIYRNNHPNIFLKSFDYDDIELFNGDSLFIPGKNIIHKTISISVDSRNSIKIPWLSEIKYEDIFYASNVNINNIKKIELVRRSFDNNLETYLLQNYDGGEFNFMPNDYIVIQLNNSFKPIETVVIKGSVSSPGLYPLAAKKENLNSIISRSGGLLEGSSIEDIIIKRDTSLIGSINGEIILSPNDTIFINDYNGIVSVEGEVNNPGKIEWKNDRLAKDFISLAGGLNAYADKNHIIYIAPHGEALKLNKKSRQQVLPGSKIIVKQLPSNELNVKPDRFQQISSIITSLVTIAILANSTSNSN